MRIAFFVHNFPPEFRGGTELVVLGLAKTFQAQGDDVFVVSGTEQFVDGGSLVEEQYEGLRVVRIHRDPSEVYGLDLAYPITGPRISELISEERPDCIHVHHWSTLGWDILQRAAAMGIRGGATLHDLWVTCPRFFRQPQNGLRCPVEGGRDSCPACVQRDLENVPINFVEDAVKVRDHRIRRELGLASRCRPNPRQGSCANTCPGAARSR